MAVLLSDDSNNNYAFDVRSNLSLVMFLILQAAQYSNIAPVPSSPVLFNSSQTAAPAPPAIYPTPFQIDNSQVLYYLVI